MQIASALGVKESGLFRKRSVLALCRRRRSSQRASQSVYTLLTEERDQAPKPDCLQNHTTAWVSRCQALSPSAAPNSSPSSVAPHPLSALLEAFLRWRCLLWGREVWSGERSGRVASLRPGQTRSGPLGMMGSAGTCNRSRWCLRHCVTLVSISCRAAAAEVFYRCSLIRQPI